MESGGNHNEKTTKEDGSSMTPIAWHCLQANELRKRISEDLSTLNNINQDPLHGPAGAGHDPGDEDVKGK